MTADTDTNARAACSETNRMRAASVRSLQLLIDQDQLGGRAGSAATVLSGRECEVVHWIAEGLSTKEIARWLSISVKTVETHRRNLMEKLSIDSIAGLARYAVLEGMVAL
jgi:DNA-binding NarL/FixJ family response regulator